MIKIKPGKYQHYKGNFYKVIGVIKHSEILEDMVLYECLYDNPVSKLWVRTLKMFVEKIEINGKKVPRFKFCSSEPGDLPQLHCPRCIEGNVVTRRTKRGKVFYGCSRYPKCDYASWTNPKEPPQEPKEKMVENVKLEEL